MGISTLFGKRTGPDSLEHAMEIATREDVQKFRRIGTPTALRLARLGEILQGLYRTGYTDGKAAAAASAASGSAEDAVQTLRQAWDSQAKNSTWIRNAFAPTIQWAKSAGIAGIGEGIEAYAHVATAAPAIGFFNGAAEYFERRGMVSLAQSAYAASQEVGHRLSATIKGTDGASAGQK